MLRWRTLQWRRTVRGLVPPPALDAVREGRRRLRREPREWELVGYAWPPPDAGPRVRGWDEPSVGRRYEQVWERYRAVASSTRPLAVAPEQVPEHDLARGPYDEHDVMFHNSTMTLAYALARAARMRERLRVLDWGGATGHVYLLARALFPDVQFEYHCKELPATAHVGRALAPEVVFIDDERPFDRDYDLVMASGSLQYAEDWPNLIARLLAASREYVFLSQVPVVHQSRPYVVVQRPYRYGYRTEYLSWCLRRDELLGETAARGAQLVREFVHGFKPPVAGAPEPPEYRGFLLRVGDGAHDARAAGHDVS